LDLGRKVKQLWGLTCGEAHEGMDDSETVIAGSGRVTVVLLQVFEKGTYSVWCNVFDRELCGVTMVMGFEEPEKRAVIESIDVNGRSFRSVVKWANLAALNDQLF
jgi:hypothetical protein